MTFRGFKSLSFLVLVGPYFLIAESVPKTASLETLKSTATLQNAEILALEQSLKELRATEERASAPFYPIIGIAGGGDHESSKQEKKTVGVGYVYGNLNLFRGFADA